MPKTIYLVSKTHLDLGFTDLAENIRRRYIDDFIPKAIRIAEKLNSDGKRNSYGLRAPGLSKRLWSTARPSSRRRLPPPSKEATSRRTPCPLPRTPSFWTPIPSATA